MKYLLLLLSLVTLTATAQQKRVIRGSTWFEQNVSNQTNAANVLTALNAVVVPGGGNMVNSGAAVVGMIPVATNADGNHWTPTNGLPILNVDALSIIGAFEHSLAVGTGFTLTDTNDVYLVCVNAQTITLETAAGHRGREHTVKTIAPAVTATVATTSSQLIDGASTYSLSASNKFVRVIADGTNWWIVGSN